MRVWVLIGIGLTLIGGWIHNIIMLAHCNYVTLNPELVLRTVGIFVAPLGVVLGFIGHF